MKVSIKAPDRTWILDAWAKQWQNDLLKNGYEVTIDRDGADRTSEIHIHFIADNAQPVEGRLNIVVVTHIDFYWKILNCIQLYRKGVSFICMSKHTESVLRKFMPGAQIFTITPQSLHFGPIPNPRKITFGLFFRLYDDDRKNQSAIETLVNTIIEHNSKANLLIFGAGFESILRGKPTDSITYISISAEEFDVEAYRSCLRTCDYVVYFGRDEGAISVLDAATLGIPVIATDQGYHRDIPLPTGSLLLETADAICEVIQQLIHSKSGEPSMLTLSNVIETSKGSRCSGYEFYILILRSIFVSNPFYLKSRFTQDRAYNYKRSAASKAVTYVLDQIKRRNLRRPNYVVGSMIDFSKVAQSRCYMGAGWSKTEIAGVWTDGLKAELCFRCDPIPVGALSARISLTPFLVEGFHQQVDVFVNGTRLCEWTFPIDETYPRRFNLTIPSHISVCGKINIRFDIRNPGSPKHLGVSEDQRSLGVMLHEICLTDEANSSTTPVTVGIKCRGTVS